MDAPLARRKPRPAEFALLRLWHAVLFGAFIVAYASADEDTYAVHLFAGYLALAAIGLRLVIGLVAPAGSPLRLPRPSPSATLRWLARPAGRNPAYAWMAAVLLLVIGLAAITGVAADVTTALEDPHQVISELSLWLVVGHGLVVLVLLRGHRILARLFPSRSPVR